MVKPVDFGRSTRLNDIDEMKTFLELR